MIVQCLLYTGGKCAQLIQNVNPYIHSPYIRAEIKFRLKCSILTFKLICTTAIKVGTLKASAIKIMVPTLSKVNCMGEKVMLIVNLPWVHIHLEIYLSYRKSINMFFPQLHRQLQHTLWFALCQATKFCTFWGFPLQWNSWK